MRIMKLPSTKLEGGLLHNNNRRDRGVVVGERGKLDQRKRRILHSQIYKDLG